MSQDRGPSRHVAALLLMAALALVPLLAFGSAAGASAPPPEVSFGASQVVTIGANNYTFVAGDFDSDGDKDILANNYSAGDCDLLTNDGAGAFALGADPGFFNANSFEMAAGDLDRDGDLDIAAADDPASRVLTFLGNGAGGFSSAGNAGVGAAPRGLTLGDTDRDGDLDVAVTNLNDGTVSILANDGSGAFSGSATLTAGSWPWHPRFGDIDNDGDLDLAVPNQNSGNVSIWLNNGSGVFSSAAAVTAGTNPKFLTFGDLDSDGDLDMAVSNSLFMSGAVNVRLNDGTGSFPTGSTINLTWGVSGGNTGRIASADLDRDGDLDLAVVSEREGGLTVLLGNGTGAFTVGPVFGKVAGSQLTDLLVEDFSRDGRPDAAAVHSVLNENGAAKVFLSTTAIPVAAAYREGPATPVGDWPGFIAPGDFNGDGDLDMVVSNGAVDSLSVRLGDGAGGFSNGTTATTGDSPQELATADFNRDGKLDLAVANALSNDVSIRLGTGAGAFSNGVTLTASGLPESIATADFDRNGTADLVVANTSSDTVGIRLGNGNGAFSAETTFGLGPNTSPESLAPGDFDRDGNPDLAVENQHAATISILIGDGAGDFSFGTTRTTSSGNTGKMVACDLDRDGDLDLGFRAGGTVATAMNDGNAVFTLGPAESIGGSWDIRNLAAGDFDRNGVPDLAVAFEGVGYGETRVLLRDGYGNFLSPVYVPSGDNTSRVAAGDFDADGQLDLAVSNFGSHTVTLFLADTEPPITTLTLDPATPDAGTWYSAAPQIGLSADETANICYQWDSTEGTWWGYSTTITAQEGSHTLYYYAADLASNGETVQGSSIKVDSLAPVGTLTLAGGATYTTTTSVSASSSVSDTGSGMNDMCFSADSTAAFGSWEPYSATATATLSAAEGTKIIYGRYRDAAGHVMETSDSIVLDSTAPTGTMVLNGGAATAGSLAVTVDSTVTDATSGMNGMRCSNDGGATWEPWKSYAPTCSATLAIGTYPAYDGTRTITVQYADAVGSVLQLADDIRFIRPKATVGTPVLSPPVPRKYVFFTTWGIINQKVTGSARLYLYRRVAGRWVQYPGRGRYLSAKNYSYGSRTKYLLRFKVPYSGSWYVRPYYAGGPVAAANWGKIKFFTVR